MPITAQTTESMSPQIALQPKRTASRLIDQGLLHGEASNAGFAERYARGETSHTIHVWWARRPHSSMRALVFASLCKDTSSRSIKVLKQLCFSDADDILAMAREILSADYSEPPRILDMFGGGGTISSEGLKMGAEVFALDANELAVFIQRCNLVYSQRASKRAASVLRESGNRVLYELTRATEGLFPLRGNVLSEPTGGPVGYVWTYLTPCKSCGFKFFLSKRRHLSKKQGKSVGLIANNYLDRQSFILTDELGDESLNSAWQGRTGVVRCPKCSARHERISVDDCEDALVVTIKPGALGGKVFELAPTAAVPSGEELAAMEQLTLESLRAELPVSRLPRWSGIVNPALYGIETHADFLNPRQRVVLLLLIRALRNEYARLNATHDTDTSRYVIGMLSALIDQLIDWNCRLSMWIPENEQVGRAFCGPGISMLWDYVEIDPVLSGPANLWSKLDRIVAGSQSIKQSPHTVSVQHGYAQELPYENEYFDAIVTDPPYYDNIFYNALADFFFSWKRLLLAPIEPDLFKGPVTDDRRELVASKFRSVTPEQAHEDYCTQLTLALQQAERVLKQDGVFSFVYSHSSLRGWLAFVRAFRATTFQITSVQPLSVERKQRPRAMRSEAVNTCLTFVAHKGSKKRDVLSKTQLKLAVREYGDVVGSKLLEMNWNSADAALAVFAHGVGMVANSKVSEMSDKDTLQLVESVVKSKFPSFKISDRKSL